MTAGASDPATGRLSFDLSGRRALVTGASSGLGIHFAGVLAAHGAAVTLAARRHEKAAALASEITGSGGRADACALDVRDPDSVRDAFEGAPYDIVINNAGIAADGPALDTAEQDWQAVLDTDLGGVFRVSQAAARSLKAAGTPGSIVNIASITGHRVAGGLAAYAAAKAGVIQLTRALALEWARHRIRVNAICPGYIATEINRDFFEGEAGQALIRRIPMRRLGRMEELDAPLLMLASDHGSFITGSDIVVDGGHLVTSL
ncbi:SDR family NAD(P)-dependent oxidoreductase [Profundibacterium mesophilum]|uniref:Short-chain dehydrogenasereductase n=1 Tax=Profundibacterium mesophilum KAUST100406-0324 TaxID=1037889 RepID=A0A921NWY3_9RHOB|nr:SDR family oxidoreductase [Profundibacterium mesophilum]KAF0677193.1 Short-chain dehydrogenasereductase [Profundibacterium mesophilum KAUST100406-0324]